MDANELAARARIIVNGLRMGKGDYAITSSGPMAIRGLREAKDIDIIVSEPVWEKLTLHFAPGEDGKIHFSDWAEFGSTASFANDPPGMPSANEQLQEAEEIDGLWFTKLEVVLRMKRAMNRAKDQADIMMLEDYLSKPLG